MENYTGLYKLLYDLYLKTSEKIINTRDSGGLIKIPHEKVNVSKIDFNPGHTYYEYDWNNIIYFDFYEWSTDSFTHFMQELKTLSECETAAEEICKIFKIPEDRKKFIKEIGLSGFLRLLMKQVPNGRINHQNIDRYINTFISDYEIYKSHNLFTWQIQAWLRSFHFESESIAVGDIILRRPQKEELSFVRQRSHYIDDFQKMGGRSLFSTAVLEFSFRAEKQILGIYSDEIRHEIETCLDVLRLFKVGNIYVTHQSVSPISILESGLTEYPEPPFDNSWKGKVDHQETSKYEYLVKKEEESILVDFFQKIKPILKSISPKNYLSGNYLDMALHRYKDSLLRSEVNVNRMVSAMSSLEALLSDSHSEITFKISSRVAGLLRCFGFDSVKVFEKMKTAYDVRSKLIHGDELKEKKIEFSKNHTREIVNYNRICLLICLQLKEKFSVKAKTNKKELIKKIDYSLVSDKAQKDLQEIIKKNVFIPIVYPFRKMDITEGDEIVTE